MSHVKCNHTHTHIQRLREREGERDCQGHTPPLSFLHAVAVAAFDEQLIEENSHERTAGLSLTLYKFTIAAMDLQAFLQIKPPQKGPD